MKTIFHHSSNQVLRTTCGKEFGYTFKTMKLIRDDKHNFHVVYKTFNNDYIYSSCNPFQDGSISITYHLISETEAKAIFLKRLSPDNAEDLFELEETPVLMIC
jgi:hypothetical protein